MNETKGRKSATNMPPIDWLLAQGADRPGAGVSNSAAISKLRFTSKAEFTNGVCACSPQSSGVDVEELSAKYDQAGRLGFTPELHDRHAAPWTVADQKFLTDNFKSMGTEAIALAIGRTYHSISTRVQLLRKQGLLPKPTERRVHRHCATAVKMDIGRCEAKRLSSGKYHIAETRSSTGRLSGYQLHHGQRGGFGNSKFFACSKYGGRDGALRAAKQTAAELGLVARNAAFLE